MLTEIEKPNGAARAEGARLEQLQGNQRVRGEPLRALPEREGDEQDTANYNEGDDGAAVPAARCRLRQSQRDEDEREGGA